MDKKTLRKNNLLLRKNLNQKEASNIIVSKILAFDTFLHAKNILIFYPLKNEINLLGLLECRDKNFYLPRVNGQNLEICPYCKELKKSDFNVMEPCSDKISDISKIDLVFVPAVATDKNLNRIGYGKGYYDRLFQDKNFIAKKVAVINKELVTEEINPDPYDEKVDFVITD